MISAVGVETFLDVRCIFPNENEERKIIRNPRSSSKNYIGFSYVLAFFMRDPCRNHEVFMESLEKKIFRDLLAAGHEIQIAGAEMFGKFWDR